MKTTRLWIALSLLGAFASTASTPKSPGAPFSLADKTLVAWVRPLSAEPGFMGVFCLMENSTFDGIALTGGPKKQWIAWSDFLRRTAKGGVQWPEETEGYPTNDSPICVATVYRDDTVSMYRNGRWCLSYHIEPQPFFHFSKVVSGFDHQLPCEVHELRLYDVPWRRSRLRRCRWVLAPGRRRSPSGRSRMAVWRRAKASLRKAR